MICSSLNLDLFVLSVSFIGTDSTSNWRKKRVSGHSPATRYRHFPGCRPALAEVKVLGTSTALMPKPTCAATIGLTCNQGYTGISYSSTFGATSARAARAWSSGYTAKSKPKPLATDSPARNSGGVINTVRSQNHDFGFAQSNASPQLQELEPINIQLTDGHILEFHCSSSPTDHDRVELWSLTHGHISCS